MATLIGGGDATIEVDVGAISLGDVEVKNDSGNPIPTVQGLSIPAHDYVGISPAAAPATGAQTITYKTGGSGGTTVATLTLTFSGGNLASVAKS